MFSKKRKIQRSAIMSVAVEKPMMSDYEERLAAATAEAKSLPLDKIDVSDQDHFLHNTMWPYFDRLRTEAPVHYCTDSEYGAYWSITDYKNIMAVDTNHKDFSSSWEYGGITIRDPETDFQLPMFIAMDPPKHDEQRKTVSPIVSPDSLGKMEGLIRERIGKVLDGLPRNEPFDWVDNVSIELTTQMLATLFDFPWEERRKLTRWSDVATADENSGVVDSMEQREEELRECLTYFTELWNKRVNSEPGHDLISMLAHNDATRNMEPMEYLGNIVLLIVGGNDTTRNSMTGGVYALNKFPEQYAKLESNPALVDNAISEIIRWQTPLAHMRRTALRDVELNGQKIKKGDKVVMWYLSGNHDESVITNPYAIDIERPNARRHLSFGFGIHRCVGNRLAEMQLKILWETILEKFPKRIRVLEEPERIRSNFVKGYKKMMVEIPA